MNYLPRLEKDPKEIACTVFISFRKNTETG
ncbi:unnamed protein product, partial [Allacma fusca]